MDYPFIEIVDAGSASGWTRNDRVYWKEVFKKRMRVDIETNFITDRQ